MARLVAAVRLDASTSYNTIFDGTRSRLHDVGRHDDPDNGSHSRYLVVGSYCRHPVLFIGARPAFYENPSARLLSRIDRATHFDRSDGYHALRCRLLSSRCFGERTRAFSFPSESRTAAPITNGLRGNLTRLEAIVGLVVPLARD